MMIADRESSTYVDTHTHTHALTSKRWNTLHAWMHIFPSLLDFNGASEVRSNRFVVRFNAGVDVFLGVVAPGERRRTRDESDNRSGRTR